MDLVHRFTMAADLRDDALVNSLMPLVHIGVRHGREDFETALVDIVETSAPTAGVSWNTFYDNTLRPLDVGSSPFAPIHRWARSLIEGRSVLEVGS